VDANLNRPWEADGMRGGGGTGMVGRLRSPAWLGENHVSKASSGSNGGGDLTAAFFLPIEVENL
jgi:hypothetical protein